MVCARLMHKKNTGKDCDKRDNNNNNNNNLGKVVTAARAGNLLKQSQGKQFLEIAKDKKWQGKLFSWLFRFRWEDESLSITSCFAWLKGWATCPTYTIAGMYELYEQLLPTKLYTKEKTQTSTDGEVLCRLCGKVAESVAHILAGSLAQTKYL